jgi:hypothetical protein
MGNCNCRNGSDVLDFISLVPGGTAANATYQVGLTHYTCGCRKTSIEDTTHPVIGTLNATVVGTPQDLGNGTFCCEVLIAGTVTYQQCGCCSPRTEYVSLMRCLPCSSEAVPTVTIGNVVCSPEPIMVNGNGCCRWTCSGTNRIAVTTSINVTTA